ncbi:DUF3298 and DUF4163 domain-containing protein [Flavobacterium sp. ARAG 55.4]|uniref:DUF3298 and DUF4163 domain-containing protein n=1 Tax=Flavobacterium sp. ARAG 55.4 TaxID=3451357 RepID=UPI003F47DD3F
MKYTLFFLLLFICISCSKELDFENQSFEKTTSVDCTEKCPNIKIDIPVAENAATVSDSINNTVFKTVKSIVDFGDKPNESKNYEELAQSFIQNYEKIKRDFPRDHFGWEAKIEGEVKYRSENILSITINHYTFTGGAHGYAGLRSLIFDPKTGKKITNEKLFKNWNLFKALAETRFREKYKIPRDQSINSTGMFFENDVFQVAQNIFFTNEGIILHYNPYEIAAYVDGSRELLIKYEEANDYLITK